MAILRSETNLVCVFVAGEMVDDKLSGQSRGGKGKLCHSWREEQTHGDPLPVEKGRRNWE